MRSYDFNRQLDWKSFQTLACEVVQQRERIQLQSFREGRDGGVDGLWFEEGQNIILQAKHYKQFSKLYQELEKSELKKVQGLNPKRYILVVSLELSAGECRKIYELFQGYLQRSEDLIHGGTLNSLLGRPEYHWIEGLFPNLWIPDKTVLQQYIREITDRKLRTRNAREQKKSIEACRTFVQTETYRTASRMLEKNHTVVISGQPGMGKSTIARVLALEFLSVEHYDGLYWIHNLEEIEEVWDEEEKQAFVLDDYWGGVFYREKSRYANSHLEDLIFQMKQTSNKRLILTSREYIVQQEFCLNPELEEVIRRLKMECVLKGYSDAEKAEILYRHLEASDLEWEYVVSIFYASDFIVQNHNYNPRVIDKFLKEVPSEGYLPEDYVEELLGWLKYPGKMWEGVFQKLSEEAKIVAAIVGTSYTPIRVEDIRSTYSRYVQEYGGMTEPKAFEDCITELEETVLNTYFDEIEEEILLEFENPSVQDFIWEYLLKYQEFYIPRLAKCSIFYNQLLTLLEHFRCHDEAINELVRARCVEGFYSLPMRLEDYGDPDFGEQMEEGTNDWSGRAFHLMRVSKSRPGDRIWEFIRQFVDHFFEHLEQDIRYDGVGEMLEFTGLLRICVKNGMRFEEKEILQNYWEHCQFEKDYVGFMEFEKIYPAEYENWKERYAAYMKGNLKEIILDTLDYYEENHFVYEMEMLLDIVPDLLKTFGLRYTKKYRQEIEEIAGSFCARGDYELKFSEALSEKTYESSARDEEEEYFQAKESAYQRLLDVKEEADEEMLLERIKEQHFEKADEQFLFRVVQENHPEYVYEFLQDENGAQVLKQVSKQTNLEGVSGRMSIFAMAVCSVLLEEYLEQAQGIIAFCAEYALVLSDKREPILSAKRFRELDCYQRYVKPDSMVEAVLFTYILEKRGKWIIVRQEMLILFLLSVHLLEMKTSEYYPDFVEPGNIEWKRILQVFLQEMDGENFRKEYVVPRIKAFLSSYEKKENMVMCLLKDIEWEMEVDDSDRICGGSYLLPDAMMLAENLKIASMEEVEEELQKKGIHSLTKRSAICKKEKECVTVFLWQEENEKYLRDTGVYSALEHYLQRLKEYIEGEL